MIHHHARLKEPNVVFLSPRLLNQLKHLLQDREVPIEPHLPSELNYLFKFTLKTHQTSISGTASTVWLLNHAETRTLTLLNDIIDYAWHKRFFGKLKIPAYTYDAIKHLREPHNVRNPQSFPRNCIALSTFIPIFACVALHLYKIFGKNLPQTIDDLLEKESSMSNTVYERLLLSLILWLPRLNCQYIADIKTCDRHVCAVLVQTCPVREWKSIAYCSSALKMPKCLFRRTDWKCLILLFPFLPCFLTLRDFNSKSTWTTFPCFEDFIFRNQWFILF